MAQVVSFQEDGHEYRLPDGTLLPSVSEILRFMSREYYSNIQQYTLDNAADRGTRVHKACEVLDKWGEVECDADIEPYVKAYVKFKREHKPNYGLIERPLHHSGMGYAGTIDRAGYIGQAMCIIDLKVQTQIKKPLVKAQLNGYWLMYESVHGDCEIDRLLCLQLKNDGTYKLHEIDKDDSEFMACYTLHKALEKKPRKKKGDPNGNTAE